MKKLIALGVLSAMLGLSACGESEPTSTPKQDTVQTTTAPTAEQAPSVPQHNPNWVTYDVGSEINYEPFAFKNEMGTPVGFEIDLLNAIGQVSQFNVNFIDTPRNRVEDTLNTDKLVIWASALSVSPERQAKMDFSEPYIDFVREVYILDVPENESIKTAADLKGKKISASSNSKAGLAKAEELAGSKELVVGADTFYLTLTNTYQGKSVGTVGDSRILQYYKQKNADVKTRIIALDNEERKDIAFAVKKGNTELLEKINQGLTQLKTDGTYDKLVEKWFGELK